MGHTGTICWKFALYFIALENYNRLKQCSSITCVCRGCAHVDTRLPRVVLCVAFPSVDVFHKKEQDMATGTVKQYDDRKGYGFIIPDNGDEPLFAHFSQIVGVGFKTLTEGQRVEYDETQGPKGKQASHIRPI